MVALIMDFLDPKKKRAHQIRLYIGYGLMAIALTIVTAVLVFEASGFDLDRKTGEIIENGLVFADTHPESAEVFINGELKGNTDLRLTIPSGKYDFEFRRAGYRSWKRSFTLGGRELLRLNYAFLFPEQLQTSDIRSYASVVAFAAQSPDRKWLIVQQPSKLNSFDVVNLAETNNPVTALTLPDNLITTATGAQSLELVEWANNNRHFIVKHTFKNTHEFILIDREQPAESLNLNKHLNAAIYDVSMRDKKQDKLYVLDKAGGTLRFADTVSKKLSHVANKVSAFKSYSDDVVLYITAEGAPKGMVRANIIKESKHHTIRSMAIGKVYSLDITRYDDEWYLAFGSDAEKKAYIYHDVFVDLEHNPSRVPMPITIFPMSQLDAISISANTRFIAVQGGSSFAVYDAEHNRQYSYDTKLPIAAGQKVKWMDGHRLAVAANNQLTVWDYDGINMQTLVSAQPNFIPFFDRDYDFLYVIRPADGAGKSAITKTPMRTQGDL
jgi:hypothetical protein